MIKAIVALTAVALLSASAPQQSVDTTPLDRVGSGLHLGVQEKRTICLEISRELKADWPVLDASYNWNKNEHNLFTTATDVPCDGVVLITRAESKDWWGSTEFYQRDIIHVQLSVYTPDDRHSAVICHELGHALGLPHSDNDGSCMDTSQNNPEPTALDLSTVGKDSWSAPVAQRTMLGVK